MNTIGWLFVFAGILVLRSVSRGRSITDIPGDMGDAMTAVLTNDTSALKEVLARKGDLSLAADSPPSDQPSGGIPAAGKHTQADLIALGKTLKTRGFIVGEGPPPFGPIYGGHSATGYHYRTGELGLKGMALDINWSPASQEPAKMDALADELLKNGWHIGWRTKGHYNHLHVDTGPAGRMNLG